MSDIKKIKDEYFLKLNENLDLNQINQIKTDLFGKNGLVSSQFKQLGKIAEDGIRDLVRSRGLGDVYKRQGKSYAVRL